MIENVFRSECKRFLLIDYVFCTDVTLLRLNQEYLNHDYYTDVITFTLSGTSLPLTAEIYISVERVKENSEKYNVSYLHELHRVMIHGSLHLCGYSDHTPILKKNMREKENIYLQKVRFS